MTWDGRGRVPPASICIDCQAHPQSRQAPVPQAQSCGPAPACATMQAACPDPPLPCAHCICKPDLCRLIRLRILAPDPIGVWPYKSAHRIVTAQALASTAMTQAQAAKGFPILRKPAHTNSPAGLAPGRYEKRPESIVHGLVPLVRDYSLIECAAVCSFVSLLLPYRG